MFVNRESGYQEIRGQETRILEYQENKKGFLNLIP